MNLKNILLPILLILVVIFISFSGNFISDAGILKTNKKIDSKIFNNFKSKYIFVFFGYVGCVDVCTPRLKELSDLYMQVKKEKIDINTLFINMLDFKDKELPQLFASHFNKEFKGVTLQKQELLHIQNEFNIYNTPSLTKPGEYNHTSFLFLLKRTIKNDYKLIRIYTNTPFPKDVILGDIKIENTK